MFNVMCVITNLQPSADFCRKALHLPFKKWT